MSCKSLQIIDKTLNENVFEIVFRAQKVINDKDNNKKINNMK